MIWYRSDEEKEAMNQERPESPVLMELAIKK